MSLLNQFEKTSIGSVNKINDVQEYINSKGQFKILDDLDAIINSWKNILLTRKGTYLNDPIYGSRLYDYLFDPLDDITKTNITSEVKNVLPRYDNRARLTDVKIQSIKSRKGFAVTLNVTYEGVNKEVTVMVIEQ